MKAIHEQVKHEENIPAMIAVLNHTTVAPKQVLELFIPSHWHRSLELSLIESARVVLQMGEKEWVIENDFTCINSGMIHALRVEHVQPSSNVIILLISYDFLKQYCPELDHIAFDLTKQKDHGELRKLFYRLKEAYLHASTYTYLEINAILLELLQHLLEVYQIPRETLDHVFSGNQAMCRNILDFLHAHYQEELSLQIMAERFSMSQAHFSRMFHHFIGNTFRDYLASYRLYQAYQDIVHTDDTIQEIAMRHGFSNVKSLIRLFKATYHDTPLHYRKAYIKKKT